MKHNRFQLKYIQAGKMLGTTIMLIALTFCFGGFLNSCQQDEDIVISKGDPVSLSLSANELVLSQEAYANTSLVISWSRGSNQGTGSSISYILEVDKAGNNFASAKTYDLGKGVYEKSFTVSGLNDLILNFWDIQAGTTAEFEVKVTANVTNEDVEDGATEIKSFRVTTYKPVSPELYIVGDATPNGWDITGATPLTASASKPWLFTYQGHLTTGNFKFAVSQDECVCQDFYTQDPADEGRLVYNEGGSGDDVQWQISESGNYKLTVNLVDLTIDVEKLAGPAFINLYIIGDASPSGWNIGNPEAFTRDGDDPFIFTYEATLSPGDFKISTFKGDWCDGEWLNATQSDQVLTATDYIVTQGCEGPDNKWHVTEETQGRYKITVNLYSGTIEIEPVMLYLIGDGGPNGWDIGAPEPMTYANGVYTFTGALGADNPTGEFKFSKYQGDWCDGDWLIAATPNQSVTNGSYKIRNGCEGDDNKWKLQDGDAGNYTITIDLDSEDITIIKQ
ncbi:MAG: SusF/SusE family outer membrane protein [Draconibacterium sp.]